MFTGIIEFTGRITQVTDLGGGKRFTVAAPVAASLKVDQSMACNGVCLTVVAHDDTTFSVEAVEETLRKTSLGQWQEGTVINLERAMLPAARLDGHIVQGHVDATARITEVLEEETGRLFTFQFDAAHRALIVPRGSIAVDGISLTVARLNADTFTVAIIPYTFAHTNACTWQVGQSVNLEFDLLGKYVIGWLAQRGA